MRRVLNRGRSTAAPPPHCSFRSLTLLIVASATMARSKEIDHAISRLELLLPSFVGGDGESRVSAHQSFVTAGGGGRPTDSEVSAAALIVNDATRLGGRYIWQRILTEGRFIKALFVTVFVSACAGVGVACAHARTQTYAERRMECMCVCERERDVKKEKENWSERGAGTVYH